MQNQEFDDRIRKQILSITKESEENEVEKIHRYVSLSKNKDLRPKKAFFFVYGIIAVILFGSISYIYLNTDTVPSSWVSAWFTAPASNSSSNHSKRIAYAQVGSSLPIPLVKSADRTAHIASKAEKALVDIPMSSKFAQSSTNRKKTSPNLTKGQTESAIEPILADIGHIQEKTSLQVENEMAPRPSDLVNVSLAGSQRQLITPLESKSLPSSQTKGIYGFVENLQTRSEPRINLLRNSDFRLRSGVGLETKNGEIGTSLSIEAIFRSRWSIQTGFGWSRIRGHRYHSEDQYTQQTGDDFRTLYAPNVEDEIDLLNIKENYQLLRVPLVLARHQHLSKNTALYLGIGTTINTRISGRIHYDIQREDNPLQQIRHNSTIEAPIFSSLTALVGIEKNFNLLTVRIMPTLGCSLQNVSFEKKDLTVGGRIQMLYTLK